MRSKSRECAFKIIYAEMFAEADQEGLRRGVYKTAGLNEEEREYAEALVNNVNEHKEELCEVLDRFSIGFSEKRMFPIDKSLLLMALAEMRYMEGVPPVVSIDESVGLARKYSTEKSAGFVNGVLAAYLTEEGK